MTNDHINKKLSSNKSIRLSNLKIKLEDKCNEIVFDGITDRFGKVKISICNNEVYKLVIYSNLSIIKIPLIARKNKLYCINISDNKRKEHFVTFLLKDKYYPNIKIENIIFISNTMLKPDVILAYCKHYNINIKDVVFVDDRIDALRKAESLGITSHHPSSFME